MPTQKTNLNKCPPKKLQEQLYCEFQGKKCDYSRKCLFFLPAQRN